jgi:hypothetical protein
MKCPWLNRINVSAGLLPEAAVATTVGVLGRFSSWPDASR